MILNILDSTILNVAAPSIQRDLSLSASALEWIAAAYTLAIAVGLLAGGRLGDAFGRKRMLMVGLVGFVASSVLCSVAWSSESLIARPRPPGAGGGGDDPADLRPDPRHLRPGRDRQGVRGVRAGHRAVDGARPGRGRRAHRARPVRHRLALAVPHQRPGRPVRDRRRPPGAARHRARAPRRAPRLGRHRADRGDELPRGVPAGRGPHPRVAGVAGRRGRRRCARCWSSSAGASAAGSPAARPRSSS